MKIGILGGTFDPIHVGHRYIAEECINLLSLDKLIVIPNGDPPHKDNKVTNSYDRYSMTKLALNDIDKIELSDIEVNEKEASYSYKTLEKLRLKYPLDELYFIIGADSLVNFLKWKNPEKIVKNVKLVCFDRPGYLENEVKDAKKEIEKLGACIILLDSLNLEISSTDIRNRIKMNKPYKFFLENKVVEYINEKKLYK